MTNKANSKNSQRMRIQHQYDLTTFKRDINLATFSAMYGYEVDRKKSTKTSIAMKSGNGKIIISKKGSNWVYFSVFDETDSGTIVDFVANRSRKTIPDIGMFLSEWLGLGEIPIPTYQIENQSYDQDRVKAIFRKCKPIASNLYLESRGLSTELLNSWRFQGRVLIDRHGNIAFPHFSDREVCGLELKNRQRGVLVKGSQRTFWRSNSRRSDKTLVVTEAVIDSLSYQQLFQLDDAMFLATGGGVSANQCQLLTRMLNETQHIERVLIATDNDSGGDRIAKRLLETVHKSQFNGSTSRHRPLHDGDDWNDALLEN